MPRPGLKEGRKMWHWVIDFLLILLLFVFMIDKLTRLWVRRVYDLMYKITYKSKGWVILFDLDGFKAVNDKFGHKIGDKVLRRMGWIIQKESFLYGFRYGGDEFAVLLPAALDKKDVMGLAKKIVQKMEKACESYGVTVSFGLGRTEEEADQDLYKKKSEKNTK